MEETNLERPRPRPGRWILGIFLGLVLLAAGIWLVVFRVNRFTLSIRLKGDDTTQLEFGEIYTEPGAEVMLCGSLFWKAGFPVEEARLQITDDIVEDTLGRYTVSYHAAFAGWRAGAERRVNIIDTVCPVISLVEDPEDALLPGQIYQEAGFTARDNYDGDITDRVIRTEAPGIITYSVIDSSGNPSSVEREIPYHDSLPPEIHLQGGEQYAITVGSFYTEPGFEAVDNVDGDLTGQVSVEGEVNWLSPGKYPITYTVSDTYENVTTVTREVEVSAMPRPEVEWPQGKTIYLTFDDGPSPYTPQLLDVLDKYGVKATFFVTDSGYGNVMQQIVDRGHSIGIHTVSHNYSQVYASPEAYFDDLRRMQDIIYENTGVRTTLMRFPGGSSNTVSRETYEGLMTVLSEAVQDAGFQYFDWNVDSDDAGSARRAETVFHNVTDGVSQKGVSVVLQHDVHGYSVAAVEDIICWGLDNGYRFLPLSPSSPGFHHGVNN